MVGSRFRAYHPLRPQFFWNSLIETLAYSTNRTRFLTIKCTWAPLHFIVLYKCNNKQQIGLALQKVERG